MCDCTCSHMPTHMTHPLHICTSSRQNTLNKVLLCTISYLNTISVFRS